MSPRSLEKHELPLAHTKPVQRSFRVDVVAMTLLTVKLGKTFGSYKVDGVGPIDNKPSTN